jgi:hypothetical protein
MVTSRRESHNPLPTPGLIVPDALYRIDELRARMGWAKASYQAACRRGLRVQRCGKRAYVLGADAIAFVASDADSQGGNIGTGGAR